MRFANLWAAALLMVSPAIAETFSYELYALEAAGPRLMNAGAREYSVGVVKAWPRDPKIMDKELSLGNGFAVGLSDHGEPKLTGIGFWLRRVPSPMEATPYAGFSWEWFDLVKGEVFEHRQGEGRIRIRTRTLAGQVRVERVEFLNDMKFEMNARRDGAPGTYTHELRIKKGSVLAFEPLPKAP